MFLSPFSIKDSILYEWLKPWLSMGGTVGILKDRNAGDSPQTSWVGTSGVGPTFVSFKSSPGGSQV